MRVSVLSSLAMAVLLSGCARQPQQMMMGTAETALRPGQGTIGVIMTPLPKVDTQFPGASCLLCIAAANAAHSTLTSYVQTLPHEDLPKLKDEVANRIRKRGIEATVINEELKLDALADTGQSVQDLASKDFKPLKAKYNVDKLMVIDVTTLAVSRPYSAYIPTGVPHVVLEGKAYLVNLSDNRYELYRKVRVSRAADGQWDEAPKYPGLTNTYYQALELGKDDLLRPFSQ
jgi:hypothetical protein